MDETLIPDLGFDWGQLLELLQTKGIDFGINLLIALAIFYFGKLFISLAVRGLRNVMRRQEVDKTLETFICNLVRIALLVVVIIAAIGALGVETTSFIAIFGAAGLAIGLATDEVRRYGLNAAKRGRLVRAGAHLVVPDFSQMERLLSLLNLAPNDAKGS